MGNHNSFPPLKCTKIRKLEGAVVIITGASSGLGKQLALLLSKKNIKLVITGRNTQRLKATQQQCESSGSATIQTFEGDLTNTQTCRQLITQTYKKHRRIDILVLNAGVNAHFQFSKLQDLNVFQSLMRTNFYANVFLTKFALPVIKRSSGGIVVISSLSGKFGLPSRSAYCASKFALNGFFQSLRTQQNIPIMMVYPTSLQTPMRNNSLIKGSATSKNEKRQDPRQCAQMIVEGIQKRKQEIFMPKKGWYGVVLQPVFPRLIRWKVSRSAKL